MVQQAKGRVRPTTSINGQPDTNGPLQRVSGGVGTIQRVYAGLNPMQKARVDQLADADYAEKALQFELGMAHRIQNNARVHATVDAMLGRLKAIVEA